MAIFGTDEFDKEESLSIKDYLESGIFLINKVNLILTLLYVASVGAFLFAAKNAPINVIELVTIVSMINLTFTALRSAVNLKLMKKLTQLRLKLGNLPHYITASIIMATIIYLIRVSIGALPQRIFETAPIILLLVVLGAIIYLGLLYLLSKDFRKFLGEIRIFLNSLRSKDSASF